MNNLTEKADGHTSTDDVRRIRQNLLTTFENDVRKLGDHATAITKELADRLGLRLEDDTKRAGDSPNSTAQSA